MLQSPGHIYAGPGFDLNFGLHFTPLSPSIKYCVMVKKKGKANPVTGRGGP
jgi:hypothetical protein